MINYTPRFITELEGRWMEDDVRFVIKSELVYISSLFAEARPDLGPWIRVPAGFVTDFASVPRVPVAYWLFGDRAHREAVIHDYLYQKHLVTKGMADKIFLEAMKCRKKGFFTRWGMYLGVVLGGRSSYKSGPNRYAEFQFKNT